jgi:hypothetical protein
LADPKCVSDWLDLLGLRQFEGGGAYLFLGFNPAVANSQQISLLIVDFSFCTRPAGV